MQFTSFSDFIAMGGYGFYVWLSFGVSALLIFILIINSLLGHKSVIQNIAARQKREDKLRQVRKQRAEANAPAMQSPVSIPTSTEINS